MKKEPSPQAPDWHPVRNEAEDGLVLSLRLIAFDVEHRIGGAGADHVPTDGERWIQGGVSAKERAAGGVLGFDVFFDFAGVGGRDELTGVVVPVGVEANEQVAFVPFDGIAMDMALAGPGRVEPEADVVVFLGGGGVLGSADEKFGVGDADCGHMPGFFGDPDVAVEHVVQADMGVVTAQGVGGVFAVNRAGVGHGGRAKAEGWWACRGRPGRPRGAGGGPGAVSLGRGSGYLKRAGGVVNPETVRAEMACCQTRRKIGPQRNAEDDKG